MALFQWRGGTSSSYTEGANWLGASAPGATPDIFVGWGSTSITGSNRSAQTDQDPISFEVGGNYTGSIGSVAVPLLYDDISGRFICDARGSIEQEIVVAWATCAQATIKRCGPGVNGCRIHTGTTTRLDVLGGTGVRIGASATVSFMEVQAMFGNPVIAIESGATMPLIHGSAGVIRSEGAIGTIRITGTCNVYMLGASTGAIAAVEVIGPHARLWLAGNAGFVITNALAAEGGVISTTHAPDGNVSGAGWTFTNSEVRSGGVIQAKSADVFTNAPKIAGGYITGYSGSTTAIVLPGGK